jgi:acyl-CoA hydrolase
MIPHRDPSNVPPGNHEPAETRFVEMVFPEQANHYGTLFGGNALSLMGKAAFVAASRHVRSAVVMGTCDKVEFHHPVAVGELVEVAAHVSRVGRASMTVEVEVTAETLVSGARRPAMSGRFEMVVVDISGRPIPISIPESSIPKEV